MNYDQCLFFVNAGTLETAIRATNAQYDNQDILKRLDARLLQVSAKKQGDRICYNQLVDSSIVPVPLNTSTNCALTNSAVDVHSP